LKNYPQGPGNLEKLSSGARKPSRIILRGQKTFNNYPQRPGNLRIILRCLETLNNYPRKES